MKKIFIIGLVSLCLVTGCNKNENCECEKKEKTEQITECTCNCIPPVPNDSLVGKTFTKTYHIYDIEPSNDYDYVYITIRGFQEEEIETVKVKRELFDSLEEENYEFTFKITNGLITESIKSIFECTEVTNITKTDKTGLEQVNEYLVDL